MSRTVINVLAYHRHKPTDRSHSIRPLLCVGVYLSTSWGLSEVMVEDRIQHHGIINTKALNNAEWAQLIFVVSELYQARYNIHWTTSVKVHFATWKCSICSLQVASGCINIFCKKQTNSMVWVRERTIPTERPPLVGEVSANFCG
jgi:hypothetical protein